MTATHRAPESWLSADTRLDRKPWKVFACSAPWLSPLPRGLSYSHYYMAFQAYISLRQGHLLGPTWVGLGAQESPREHPLEMPL